MLIILLSTYQPVVYMTVSKVFNLGILQIWFACCAQFIYQIESRYIIVIIHRMAENCTKKRMALSTKLLMCYGLYNSIPLQMTCVCHANFFKYKTC